MPKNTQIAPRKELTTPKPPEKRKNTNVTPPSLQKDKKKSKAHCNDSDNDQDNEMGYDGDGDVEDRKYSNEEILSKKLDGLVQAVEFLTMSVQEIKDTLEETKKDLRSMRALKEELSCVKEQNGILLDKIRYQEDYSRRDNVIVTGIEEKKDEDCREIAAKLLKDGFGMENIEIVRTHRIGGGRNNGHEGNKKDRKLIIRFKHHSDKEEMMKKKARLKDTMRGVYLDDDYSEETMRRRTSMLPILREIRKQDSRAHLRGDKLYSNGRLYTQRSLSDLPIDTHLVCTKSEGDATLFAGKYSKLSSLYEHSFVLDGREWHSVEQFVQHSKAEDAGDLRAAREIRISSDPLDSMAVGRRVRPGNNWKSKGPEAMRRAQIAKFSTRSMKLVLQNTRRVIAEATRDRYWGIGVALHDKDCMNSHKWQGENMVGKILMEVRDQLG